MIRIQKVREFDAQCRLSSKKHVFINRRRDPSIRYYASAGVAHLPSGVGDEEGDDGPREGVTERPPELRAPDPRRRTVKRGKLANYQITVVGTHSSD